MIVGKTFKIKESNAYARDDNFEPRLDADGNRIVIPKGEEVKVLDWHSNLNRLDYVKVENWGWTARNNFDSGLLNEVVRSIPPEILSTADAHKTVTDSNALIRIESGGRYIAEGRIIPHGEWVIVKGESADKKYVQVAYTRKLNNLREEDDSRKTVWTSASNLSSGWFDVFGLNAQWEKGDFLGLKKLNLIVGKEGELEYVIEEYYEDYLKLVNAARKDGVNILLNSGFRTWRRQSELYDAYRAGNGVTTARPGFSNHQQGKAFDLNTGGFSTPVYNWLKANAPKYGFIRTVSHEHWHWEYRPDDAKNHGHKMPSVDDE